jgi:CheY-like chemotaxis protein
MPTPRGRADERVVLLVDDDALVRHYMVRSFAEAGYRTLAAANGQEALTLLSTVGPSVICAVVSDFVMPVTNGLQLAAAMSRQCPTVPLLLVAARPPEAWSGPFLLKPFNPPDLVAVVEGLLPPEPAKAPD